MELFSGGKNTIGTPNLLEKFKIVIIDLLIDKTKANSHSAILRDIDK